jgi:molybdopterin-biosynthesis enzyme MoeA-like protein
MAVSLILIGNELLTGKRRDKHFVHMIEVLRARDLELSQVTLIGDHASRISAVLRHSLATQDIVFCFGGIGSTPDDRTRAAAASAAGVRLVRHRGAAAQIEAQFGPDAYPQRIRMADLPEGCDLIPNPYNRVPGFSLGRHHFLPGFPQMAWPMVDWVLTERYPGLSGQTTIERCVRVLDTRESELVALQEALLEQFPMIQLSSLPHLDATERWVELGIKGEPAIVQRAFQELLTALRGLEVRYHSLD